MGPRASELSAKGTVISRDGGGLLASALTDDMLGGGLPDHRAVAASAPWMRGYLLLRTKQYTGPRRLHRRFHRTFWAADLTHWSTRPGRRSCGAIR